MLFEARYYKLVKMLHILWCCINLSGNCIGSTVTNGRAPSFMKSTVDGMAVMRNMIVAT